nr:SDR family oxidoreductase [Pinisolibacter aquiterrae]
MPSGLTVVIGGSGGIGRVICRRLARCGADVALSWHRNRAAAAEIADEIAATGGEARVGRADLGDPDSVGTFFADLTASGREIGAVIVATGADIGMKHVGEVDPAEWRRVIDGDLNGFFTVVQAALPHLRRSSGSLTALTTAGIARHAHRDILSIAPKAAIESLIRAVAREEGRHGVRANAVALGPIDAGLLHRLAARVPEGFMDAVRTNTALRRIGTAEEAADAAVFLASDAASYITGASLIVDGGFSI